MKVCMCACVCACFVGFSIDGLDLLSWVRRVLPRAQTVTERKVIAEIVSCRCSQTWSQFVAQQTKPVRVSMPTLVLLVFNTLLF